MSAGANSKRGEKWCVARHRKMSAREADRCERAIETRTRREGETEIVEQLSDEQPERVAPLDVDCHTCHADASEPCRWPNPSGGEFHTMREIRAREMARGTHKRER